MFSTIKKKKCKCGCGRMPSIGYAGFYRNCAPEKIKEVQDAKTKKQRSDANKRKLSKVKALMDTDANIVTAQRIFDNELKEWFAYHMEHAPKRCENCGADLSHYNMKGLHNSQHHIIEKSETNGCPSVATELLNHMVLGYWCGCHSQWHTSYHNAQKMRCFRLAKARFDRFKHLIAEGERHKIPECFLINESTPNQPTQAIK